MDNTPNVLELTNVRALSAGRNLGSVFWYASSAAYSRSATDSAVSPFIDDCADRFLCVPRVERMLRFCKRTL